MLEYLRPSPPTTWKPIRETGLPLGEMQRTRLPELRMGHNPSSWSREIEITIIPKLRWNTINNNHYFLRHGSCSSSWCCVSLGMRPRSFCCCGCCCGGPSRPTTFRFRCRCCGGPSRPTTFRPWMLSTLHPRKGLLHFRLGLGIDHHHH